MHVPINLNTLMAEGSCISDLPRYPWDHQRSYWHETRVAKEWRLREYPYHDLLGVKVTETTALQPIWRNLFHLDNVPWIRDHKINGEIVFPFAGYVGMAAEAVKQVTGIHASVSFRRVVVSTALVVHEGSPTELVTTFRRQRLTHFLDSSWWEFTISSHNGHAWLEHCTGEVTADDKSPVEITNPPESLPRKVDAHKWYDTVRNGGIDYGPHFTSLEHITTSTTSDRLAVAKMRNNWHGDEASYHLHPVILDSYLQLLGCAARFGLSNDYRAVLPTSVGSLTLFRCDSDRLTVSAAAKLIGDDVLGYGSCIADSNIVLQVSDVGMSFLDRLNQEKESSIPITGRSEWVRHIDFESVHSLIQPSPFHTTHATSSLLDELIEIAVLSSQRSAVAMPENPDMAKYKKWLLSQTVSRFKSLDEAGITTQMNSLVQALANTPAASVATAIAAVCSNTESIISGNKNTTEMLVADRSFNKARGFLQAYNASGFFKCFGESKPCLRVLELGAGSGEVTVGILKNLTRPDRHVLYSEYVFTDASSGIINSAKERFKGIPNLKFATLDISKDPALQGFQDVQFDLVIANGVMHTTARLNQSLRNVCKMLGSNGRLLLQEPRPDIKWAKYVFGIFPGWDIGAQDARSDGPFADPKRWKEELEAAGFQQLDADAVLDSQETFRMNTIIIAKPRREVERSKKISLVDNNRSAEPSPLSLQLELQGFEVSRSSLYDASLPGQDVIVILDEEKPFFEDIDLASFEQFKAFISKLHDSGVFWITRPSQVGCQDPRYAQIIGLARTIRNEKDIDFATCESNELSSSVADIVKVFNKFHLREKDGILGPDFEYAIHRGATFVNRFFPFSLDSEVASSANCNDIHLTIQRPGRLGTLKWTGWSSSPPEADEVEVTIYSTGLNFRVRHPLW
jgi:acyl transferase domain-containing protein